MKKKIDETTAQTDASLIKIAYHFKSRIQFSILVSSKQISIFKSEAQSVPLMMYFLSIKRTTTHNSENNLNSKKKHESLYSRFSGPDGPLIKKTCNYTQLENQLKFKEKTFQVCWTWCTSYQNNVQLHTDQDST